MLYHLVPKNLAGQILYPLNQLKVKFPEAYLLQAKKYEGRESLMQRQVPPLACLWGDIIHLCPVEPVKIRDAFIQAKLDWYSRSWFVIQGDRAGLCRDNTAIFIRQFVETPKQLEDFNSSRIEFVPYSKELLRVFSKVPPASQEYLNLAKVAGEKPFLFNCIPHVLYRGTIDIRDFAVLNY